MLLVLEQNSYWFLKCFAFYTESKDCSCCKFFAGILCGKCLGKVFGMEIWALMCSLAYSIRVVFLILFWSFWNLLCNQHTLNLLLCYSSIPLYEKPNAVQINEGVTASHPADWGLNPGVGDEVACLYVNCSKNNLTCSLFLI